MQINAALTSSFQFLPFLLSSIFSPLSPPPICFFSHLLFPISLNLPFILFPSVSSASLSNALCHLSFDSVFLSFACPSLFCLSPLSIPFPNIAFFSLLCLLAPTSISFSPSGSQGAPQHGGYPPPGQPHGSSGQQPQGMLFIQARILIPSIRLSLSSDLLTLIDGSYLLFLLSLFCLSTGGYPPQGGAPPQQGGFPPTAQSSTSEEWHMGQAALRAVSINQ